MVTRRIHGIFGQSNPRGTRPKSELTDTRYDLTQTDVRQWTRLDAVFGGTASAAMTIPSSLFSMEPAYGYLLRNTAGEYPLIFRSARSGASLETSWDVPAASADWGDTIADMWSCYEAAKTEFAGDVLEFGSLVWWNAEADVQNHAWSLAFEANLRELVRAWRREFGKALPVVLCQLSSLAVPGGGFEDPGDLNTVRAAFTAVAASEGNCAVVDLTPYEIIHELTPVDRKVHFSADATMLVGDACFAAYQTLSAGTQHVKTARAFPDLTSAQTFANAAQTACGSRSENPASGGFARRLGSAAKDPWPSTARSAVMKHPVQNTWYVPIDPGMVGFGLDLATNLRPVDLSYLVFV